MALSTRAQFKDYCLRKLGFPVIDINVDDDQIEDRIDEALQYWQDYHFDGTQKVYYVRRLTDEDRENKYIDLSDVRDEANTKMEFVGISRIFPIHDSNATITMFDLRYQLRLNELYDFTAASYINYTMTMQHLRTLEQMFSGEVPIRYARHTEKLYVDWNWGSQALSNQSIIIAEAYVNIDPTINGKVWNDRWLKEYTTALIKRQWGNNMKKFSGMQLPGGVSLNGDKIFNEAIEEINKLQDEMETNYGAPLEFMMN